MAEPFDLLLTGCDVLAAAGLIRRGMIGVRGSRLAYVGAADATLSAARVIDGAGLLAMPGYVNVHTHAVLALARGMTEDLGWAPAYTPGVPHVVDVREEEAAALAQLTGLELMLAGSTTINDMYCHAHATLPAMAALGLRVSCSAWIHDVDFTRVHDGVWQHDPAIGARTLRYGVELAERWQGAFEGRASVMLAPHAIDTCSIPFLRDVAAERDRLGVRVMTHMAQSRIEVAQVARRDGCTPIEAVEQAGLLDERLIAAHCVVMTPSDIQRAGRAGITVAHAPKVNMTGGYLPVTSALRQAGARIALATDNMHGDITEVMRWALASGRLQDGAVSAAWQPEDVFRMATLDAAAAMGREHDLGSLAEGKKADIVLFDLRRAHLTPAFHPLRTLVHTGTGRDVDTVIVDGTVVVERGRATLVDEVQIRGAGEAAAHAIWSRVTGADPRSAAALGKH